MCCTFLGAVVWSLFLSFIAIGATPLVLAVSYADWPKAVEVLAAAGASVDAPCMGLTPLMLAVNFGRADATRALLLAGASIEAQTENGATALHVAARVCLCIG